MAKSSTKQKGKVIPIKKKAAAPAAEAKATTKKPAAKKAATNSKYIGKTTGKRVQQFQDDLMKANFKAKLTDAQLAKAMRAEFPNAVAFTETHVAGIRSQWNNGKRASQDGVKPPKPLPRFDEEGNELNPRVRSGGGKGAAKKGASKTAGKSKRAAAEEEEEDDEEVDEEDVPADDEEDEEPEDEEYEEEDDE